MDSVMMDEPMVDISNPDTGFKRLSSRLQSRPKPLYETSPPPKSNTPNTPTDQTGSSKASPQPEQLSKNSPHPTHSSNDDTPRRNLRKRKRDASFGGFEDPIDYALSPLTPEERFKWKGWVELESDPVLFDFILRQYGVQNVKIQEVFSLDDYSLSELPQPVFGLVFLFKYRDDDAEEDEDAPKCPGHVWFANQTTNNACATIALMNIIMNVPQVELGDTLEAFKKSTQALAPPNRGQRLSRNDFIRSIHNSFASRIDILNADLSHSNDFDRFKKSQRRTSSSKRKPNNTPRKPTQKKKKNKDDDDSGFHYVAYVPVDGEVWRLDGLRREPVCLGPYETSSPTSWTHLARDNIMARISTYADHTIEYSLLSLCHNPSPLSLLLSSLSLNIHSCLLLESSLCEMIEDWKLFSTPSSPLSDFPFSKTQLEGVENKVLAEKRWEEAGGDPMKMLEQHKELIKQQEGLKERVSYEMAAEAVKDEGMGVEDVKRKVGGGGLGVGGAGGEGVGMVFEVFRELSGRGFLREIVSGVKETS